MGWPRCSCSRSTQGCSHSSTTNHTSTRCCGCHRTGQGRTPIPLSCQGHHFSCRRFYHKFSLLCRLPALFPKSWKIPLRSMPRRVNPPNLPLRGSKLPRSPSAATQQQAVCKKGSPRGSCTRPTQGGSQPRTTNHTPTRCRGGHRTGQL